MKILKSVLIDDLRLRTQENIKNVEALTSRNTSLLNKRFNAKSWSALECIEHLNRYSRFYLPELSVRLKEARRAPENHFVKSGFLGGYFAASVSNKPKLKKMKTFKEMNPVGSDLSGDVLTQFVNDQYELLNLLNEAQQKDLTNTKTAISISKYLKLRMGDTLRVVVYHNERHIAQAYRASDDVL